MCVKNTCFKNRKILESHIRPILVLCLEIKFIFILSLPHVCVSYVWVWTHEWYMCMSKVSFRFQPFLSTLFVAVSLCHMLSSWCGSYIDFSCLCLPSLLRSRGTVPPMASSFFKMSLLRVQTQVLVHVWPVLCPLSHLPSSHLFASLYSGSRVLHLITLWAQRWCMMQEMLSKEVAIIVRQHSEMLTFSIPFFHFKKSFLELVSCLRR